MRLCLFVCELRVCVCARSFASPDMRKCYEMLRNGEVLNAVDPSRAIGRVGVAAEGARVRAAGAAGAASAWRAHTRACHAARAPRVDISATSDRVVSAPPIPPIDIRSDAAALVEITRCVLLLLLWRRLVCSTRA